MARPQVRITQNGAVASEASVPLAISARVMTPMVFCASLVPWESATSEAVAICPHRKPASRRFCATLRVMR